MQNKLPELLDTIIIGAGPSGAAAAIFTVRRNLKVLLLTHEIGGQAALSGNIENYPGFTSIDGTKLGRRLKADLLVLKGKGLWMKEKVKVVDILKGLSFAVKTSDGCEYYSKTIIIASGRVPRMLGIPGEKEFWGKGVATSATCDTSLYSNKNVVVLGGGNSALDIAFSLQKVARSVTIINITDSLVGDKILMKNVISSPNVKVLNNHEALEIFGDKKVKGIKIRNNQDDKEETLSVSEIFIEIGWIPATSFDKLTDKNERGEIKVDPYGATSVDGIYACGDVNDLWGEQIVIAAGEGAKTGLRVAEYIAKIPHQETSNIHEG